MARRTLTQPVVLTTGRALRHLVQRKDYPLGGIPVEYKGGTIAPPDQRRSYN